MATYHKNVTYYTNTHKQQHKYANRFFCIYTLNIFLWFICSISHRNISCILLECHYDGMFAILVGLHILMLLYAFFLPFFISYFHFPTISLAISFCLLRQFLHICCMRVACFEFPPNSQAIYKHFSHSFI